MAPWGFLVLMGPPFGVPQRTLFEFPRVPAGSAQRPPNAYAPLAQSPAARLHGQRIPILMHVQWQQIRAIVGLDRRGGGAGGSARPLSPGGPERVFFSVLFVL